MDQDETTWQRHVPGLVVARVGTARPTGDPVLPWVVVDELGERIDAVDDFLKHLLACGNSPASCRSYAYDLLRWLRFLAAVDVTWQRAQRCEVRDFVLWLRTSPNPARDRQRCDAPPPGSVNARTGKPYLGTGYAPATINHAVAVLAAFHGYHAERAEPSGVAGAAAVPGWPPPGRPSQSAGAVPAAPSWRLPAETARSFAAGGAR